MGAYYFLASLLPPLEIGHVPTLGFVPLAPLLVENLTPPDKARVEHFLRLIDIENMRAFWAGELLDKRGTISAEQMPYLLKEQRWPSGEAFPLYLIDYLNQYPSDEERLAHFPLLISQFFGHETAKENGFVHDFLQFQRELRLVLVGFRAKKMQRDLYHELQYEDPKDPLVAQILAQKDAKTYEPPFEYKELKPIFEEFADSPFELNQALYEYQFHHIIELWGDELFSLDRILNYIARLILVERWLELDVQRGIQIVDRIVREIV